MVTSVLERRPTSGHHSGSSRKFIEQSASSSTLKRLPVKELTWRRPIGVHLPARNLPADCAASVHRSDQSKSQAHDRAALNPVWHIASTADAWVSVLESSGHSRPAPRGGSGAKKAVACVSEVESYRRILVLRSAHVILRRACPTWGARLEGLRASRRTAISETEPAAILRDGASRLLRMRSVGLSSIRPIRLVSWDRKAWPSTQPLKRST